jgi:signal transduction histidine kinase
MITIVFIFLILFPIFFFSAGGYHSGMPCFFVFAVLFTIFMLEGPKAFLMAILEIAVYIAICLIAAIYPETVNLLANEAAVLADIIVAFTTVSFSLGITLFFHFRLYNRQQRELEVARKQAEEYARMKSELFADMSHEMRTPLTVMSGYAQYAVEQIRVTGVNEQTLADLATIGDEAKRLAEMADGTLKILMSASSDIQHKTTTVDINILTMRLAHLFGAISARKGRKLTADIKDNLPVIQGDIDALTQLLWNILQNAITHSEGDIWFSADANGEKIRIVVKDNGAGIPPELLPHIFERGVSGREGGSGIGLSICREIAQRHGGDIAIESEPRLGTTVTVEIPTLREALVNG